MGSKEVIKILEKNGWHKSSQKGSHIQFKHPEKNIKVTVPHPLKDITLKTLKSISKASGIKF